VRLFFAIAVLFGLAGHARSDEPAPVPAALQKGRGLVVPADIKARIKASHDRHGRRLAAAAVAFSSVSQYDGRSLVGPIKDQGQCGSCYSFSGLGACEVALNKAGRLTPAQQLSEQQFGDCVRGRDFCEGGWPEEVCKYAKEHGLALTSDYGPYRERPGQCKKVSEYYQIDDYGYVGSDDGVPPYAAFKAAMLQYGPLSICVAADDAFAQIRPGQVFMGSGSRQVNHAIMAVGFDDTKAAGKPAILVRNSWGTSWADGGYAWVAYGANQCGYAALWCSVTALPPANPLTVNLPPASGAVGSPVTLSPVVAGGVPPYTYLADYGDSSPAGSALSHTYASAGVFTARVTAFDSSTPRQTASTTAVVAISSNPPPPGPGGAFTGQIVVATTYRDGVPVGGPVTSVVPAGAAGSGLESQLRAEGINPVAIPAIVADVLQLVRDIKAKAGPAVLLRDVDALVRDILKAVSDSAPAPEPMPARSALPRDALPVGREDAVPALKP